MIRRLWLHLRQTPEQRAFAHRLRETPYQDPGERVQVLADEHTREIWRDLERRLVRALEWDAKRAERQMAAIERNRYAIRYYMDAHCPGCLAVLDELTGGAS